MGEDQGERKFHLTTETSKQRLDLFVLEHLEGLSRAQAQKLIGAGRVLVDGRVEKAGFRFKGGERVEIAMPLGEEVSVEPEDIELEIVYEDDDLAVINKAAGMVVHPGAGNRGGTLVNALLARYPELAEMMDDPETGERLGIVHRLDRGTSGLLAVARTQLCYEALTDLLGRREMARGYDALVAGMPDGRGVIDAPVGRSNRQPAKMAVTAGGRPARTHYQVAVRMPAGADAPDSFDSARLELRLETGRTHQIRVHLAAIGHPVLGDVLYGGPQVPGLGRPALHARTLGFAHPVTGEQLRFEVDPPEDFTGLFQRLCQ